MLKRPRIFYCVAAVWMILVFWVSTKLPHRLAPIAFMAGLVAVLAAPGFIHKSDDRHATLWISLAWVALALIGLALQWLFPHLEIINW